MAGIFALVAIVLTFVKKSDSDRKETVEKTGSDPVSKKDLNDLETKLSTFIEQKNSSVEKLSEITNDEWLRITVELQNQNALLREMLAIIKYRPEEISESLQFIREIVDNVMASRLKE
jgi:PP-loop superfamily ATP-utilizing enzyme